MSTAFLPSLFRTTCLALALAAGAAHSAGAQQNLVRSSAAGVSLQVTMLPALRILGTTLVQVDSTSGTARIVERVTVRGNVSHRLVVSAGMDASTEIRVPRAGWVVASAGRAVVGETDMLGETTYLVQCRRNTADGLTAAGGCGLVFELESTDPAFPVASSRLGVASR